MTNPLISIIIPTFNRAHLFGETLDSVLAQTYQNWECIIVDDGSTDNTNEVINAYVNKDPRFQYHHRPETHKAGGNGARNYGFEISKGEFVNWFDDDDVMLPNFLKFKMEAFTPDINFVIGSGFYWFPEKDDKIEIDLKLTSFLFKDYVLWRTHVLSPSVLFRRDFLKEKALFSLVIKRGQETEFFSRLFFRVPERQYIVLNKQLFLYRQHQISKTGANSDYLADFKESQAHICIENLKRSVLLKDSELTNYCYKNAIKLFFIALEKKHDRNILFLFNNLNVILSKVNKSLAVQFYLTGLFFLKCKRGSYKVEKYFRNQKLCVWIS